MNYLLRGGLNRPGIGRDHNVCYAHRLCPAGYPFARLHPRVDAFVQKLRATPEFAKEVATPPEFDAHLAATRKANLQAGKTLEMVARF